MPGEKKKVNLVNLKTRFGQFLNKHYSCSSCYSMDKLVFGFTCEHRLCIDCNENFTDQCKVCKADIENTYQDGLQTKMYPCLEDLKNLMAIDLVKVANKLKLQQQANAPQPTPQPTPQPKPIDDELVKQVADQKEPDDKPDDKPAEDENAAKKNDDADAEQDENEEAPAADRSSKRYSKRERKPVEKASESKKNNSAANESKKSNSSVEQPSRTRSAKEQQETSVNESKTSTRIRDSSRGKETKKLDDIIKDSTVTEKQPEAEKTVQKSTRKAARTPKAATPAKSSQMVIISTSITEAEILLLKKFAKKFNAKIVNEFSEEVTHLVTLEMKPNLTTRTLKYLKSLLTHKWLLSFNWIRTSLENDELADESEFELLGITKQTDDQLGAPKRSRENPVKLFEGKQFYVDGKFGPKCGLPKADYQDLVRVGGGEVIESEKNIQDDTYIIIDTGSMARSKFKDHANAMSTADFLNCVSDFRSID